MCGVCVCARRDLSVLPLKKGIPAGQEMSMAYKDISDSPG